MNVSSNAFTIWFYNWLGIYGRWLLIGPLAALGISMIVNIWQVVGIPVVMSESYVGGTFSATQLSNISFYLPGQSTPNHLSTTNDMMQYIVFLIMLYLPIFLAFTLTRQKHLAMATSLVIERAGRNGGLNGSTRVERTEGIRSAEKETSRSGLIENMKNLVGTGVSRITQTAFPKELGESTSVRGSIPSASNYLPEQLTLTPMHSLMELAGASPGSRQSRDEAIDKLASANQLANPRERQQMTALRNEIENRAKSGNPEASIIMNEVKSRQETLQGAAGRNVAADVPHTEATINVNAPLGHSTNLEKKEVIREVSEKKKDTAGKRVETSNIEKMPEDKKEDDDKEEKNTAEKKKNDGSDEAEATDEKKAPKNETPNE